MLMVPLTFCSPAGGLPEPFHFTFKKRENGLRLFSLFHPSYFRFSFFLNKSTGQPDPRVHPCSHEDAVLPVLSRTSLCKALQQLLPQRYEGLSGKSG